MRKWISIINLLLLPCGAMAQSGAFNYDLLKKEETLQKQTYYLPNSPQYLEEIRTNKWPIIHQNKTFIYFTATAEELKIAFEQGKLSDYFIEYTPPQILNDSMRARHHVDQVHLGIDLSSSYTGKDVIIGFVDTGIEIAHPDFKDENGKTRILRFWDQTGGTNGYPSNYGYGIIYDSTHINAGISSANDDSAHGSTVAGAAAGNGLATGANKGVAPDADIIMVKTLMNAANWTNTVADACDYIFKVADSLGKRAVVNLSVGTYFGSHDGLDAASLRIVDLLEEKDGRIVVSACGNSGAFSKFHVRGQVDSDTSFVWFRNGAQTVYGLNKIYFDLYSPIDQMDYQYSLHAINPSNSFATSAKTIYRHASSATGDYYDTLKNNAGDILAIARISRTIEGENFHMQVLFNRIDSTNHYYGFYTFGNGLYDAWSGINLGLNEIIEDVPSSTILPSIIHYNYPDNEQTIVSSWNCSPHVVSVGNIRNRQGFENILGSHYYPNDGTPVGKLSPNSSKGPNRRGVTKPDVVASGDVILAAGPLWFLQEPGNQIKVAPGGWHMGNGGTSMASPVVAGIAALYLERCERGNHQSFLSLLQSTSMSNEYSGSLPNNAYGYGIINAHNLLTAQEFTANLVGDTTICESMNLVSINSSTTVGNAVWQNNTESLTFSANQSGAVYAKVYNQNGCHVQSDTLNMTKVAEVHIDAITMTEDLPSIILSTNSSNGTYQWTKDGNDIPGAISSQLILDGMELGVYNCYAIGEENCKAYAGDYGFYLGITNLSQSEISLYPNPAYDKLSILTDDEILSIVLMDNAGKRLSISRVDKELSISTLATGMYHLHIQTSSGNFTLKFIKK